MTAPTGRRPHEDSVHQDGGHVELAEPSHTDPRGRRFELLSCGVNGHALVGADAATVGPEDALVARQADGFRWHRCLRCDAWVPVAAPRTPARDRVPGRDEIDLPLRGRPLRDRWVLRLIAVDRLIHVLVLVGLAVAVFFFAGHEGSLRQAYVRIMNDLQGGAGGPIGGTGWLGRFQHFFRITPTHLREAGGAALGYAALEAAEMFGLWFGKRWAEYLTFVATTVLIPLEVYELSHSVTPLKVVTLVINVAIAVYLLLAKRLFGLRGGGRAERAEREQDMGWDVLERTGPPGPSAAGTPGSSDAGAGAGVGTSAPGARPAALSGKGPGPAPPGGRPPRRA